MRKVNDSGAWYTAENNTIQIFGKVNVYTVDSFCNAMAMYNRAKPNGRLFITFRDITSAFPNGMLPIISIVRRYKAMGREIKIELPHEQYLHRLFLWTSWAHFLDPVKFHPSEAKHDKHLVTTAFVNATEQYQAVKTLMDVILRSVVLPKDIRSAFEWSINELTDNVLNHSDSQLGGLVQATTLTQSNSSSIAFAVADSGRGILASLKEGIPTLRTDIQALGEAVKAGVTRNPKFGQGNGLAGSLRASTMSGGTFYLSSGRGRLSYTKTAKGQTIEDNARGKTVASDQNYEGTIIAGEIRVAKNFSISKALMFSDGKEYTPVDSIELDYGIDGSDYLQLQIKNETTGVGSRPSGKQIKTKIINLINVSSQRPLIIDWEGVPVISSSFADELMGKLFLELGAIGFSNQLRNINMEPIVVGLINKAVAQRLTQAKDDDTMDLEDSAPTS